jgi:DNA-binding MarR family transcriptional regulator
MNLEHYRAFRNTNIGRLFLYAHRDFQQRCDRKLKERGYTGLTSAHLTVLSFLDTTGTRIVKLAERAGMTKQSMGDLVHDLQAQGYVERAPDPTDGRAAIIRFTERGHQFLADAYAIKLEIEAEYAELLSQEGMEHLIELLNRIIAQNPPVESIG